MSRYPLAWRLTAREVRRRPGRTLLTLVGVVLGVAAVTAVMLGGRTSRAGYPGTFAALAGRASLELRAADGHAAFTSLLEDVAAIEGVSAAAGVLQIPLALETDTGPIPILLFGIDPKRDVAVRGYHSVDGGLVAQGAGVWLPTNFAALHRLRIGDEIRLRTSSGGRVLPVAGLLRPTGPARFNGGAIAVLPLAEAQTLLALPGQVNAVSVVVASSAPIPAVRQRLSDAFPNLLIGNPAERGELAGEFLSHFEQLLSSMGAVALVSGAMVILNTFLMHLGERQRQLALLRALGATRSQVTGLLVRQALLVGSIGSLLGVPLGGFFAYLMTLLFQSFLGVPLSPPTLSWALLLSFALGPAMTLAVVLVPASRAAARQPLADLRRLAQPAPRFATWPALVGVVLVLGVLLFNCGIVFDWLSPVIANPVLPFALASGLIGFACLLPVVQTPLLRLIGIAAPLLGVEGRLAVRGLLRQHARTGLTVGVIFAAVTTTIGFGVSLMNNTEEIRNWFRYTIDADYLVRAVRPDPAVIVTPASLPPDVREGVNALPGVAATTRVRFISVRHDKQAMLIIARDFLPGPVSLIVHESDTELSQRLHRGEVAVATPLARRLGLRMGDTMALPTNIGTQNVVVAAQVKEFSAGGMVAYMDYEHARRLFGFDGPHAVLVNAADGQRTELSETLSNFARERSLYLEPNEVFKSLIQHTIDGVRWLMGAMLVLVALTAAAGTANTLATNVLDQTRELGVLRAMGLTRGGLLKLVLVQALVLAMVACLCGGPIGVLLAWLMNIATPGLQGHYVPFSPQLEFVGICLLGVPLLAMLAAWLPARRAARLAIIDAVRYE